VPDDCCDSVLPTVESLDGSAGNSGNWQWSRNEGLVKYEAEWRWFCRKSPCPDDIKCTVVETDHTYSTTRSETVNFTDDVRHQEVSMLDGDVQRVAQRFGEQEIADLLYMPPNFPRDGAAHEAKH